MVVTWTKEVADDTIFKSSNSRYIDMMGSAEGSVGSDVGYEGE